MLASGNQAMEMDKNLIAVSLHCGSDCIYYNNNYSLVANLFGSLLPFTLSHCIQKLRCCTYRCSCTLIAILLYIATH